MIVAVGVIAGLGAAALYELLQLVQHTAWSYDAGAFLTAVQDASSARRIAVLAVAGVIAGVGVVLLRRRWGAGGGDVSEAVWLHGGQLAPVPSALRGVLSIVTVGMGSSLGREGAPQQVGAAAASRLAEWTGLPSWQRRLLAACGAGAGMAAIYNVPFGGAVFALEVLLGTLALPLVLPALATTSIAVAVAWVAVPNHPTYTVPTYGVSASQLVWALLAGPLAGLVAVVWVRAVGRANRLRPRTDRSRLLAPIAVLTSLGVVSLAYPALLGNGLDIVQRSMLGEISLGLLAALLVLKPLATIACLASGAPGGLFTPTIALGVLFGGVAGHLWAGMWPGAPVGSYALLGGAAMLAAAMQGPLSAVVLMLELTRHADSLMVPMLVAVTGATIVARLMRAPSVYSVRIAHDTLPVQSAWAGAPWAAEGALAGRHDDDGAAAAAGARPTAGENALSAGPPASAPAASARPTAGDNAVSADPTTGEPAASARPATSAPAAPATPKPRVEA
jgi:H+/Cl- antiporter ClcA